VLAIVAFVAWESRANEPMLDLGFFSDPGFSAAIAAIMALFFGLFALMFISTQELQSVMGYDPFAAGVRLVPLPALFVVFAQVSVRLAGRVGTRLVVTAGLAIAAAGLATGATLDADSGYGVLALALSLTGIGMGCTMAPATASIMDSAPRERAAVAAAVNDTTRLTAGAVGVAVVGSLVSAAYSQAFAGQAAATLPADAVAQAETSIASAARVAQQAGGSTGEQILALATGGFIDGARTGLLVAAAVALLGAVVAWRHLPPRGIATPPTPRWDRSAPRQRQRPEGAGRLTGPWIAAPPVQGARTRRSGGSGRCRRYSPVQHDRLWPRQRPGAPPPSPHPQTPRRPPPTARLSPLSPPWLRRG
jgi:MFS family permease